MPLKVVANSRHGTRRGGRPAATVGRRVTAGYPGGRKEHDTGQRLPCEPRQVLPLLVAPVIRVGPICPRLGVFPGT